jgi:hypothetical protein
VSPPDNVPGSLRWKVKCEKCGAVQGEPCVYTVTLRSPSNPKYRQVAGQPCQRVHPERRWASQALVNRRARERMRQESAPEHASLETLAAAHAMRAWDVQEYFRLREWLAEWGYLLTEAGRERRPDGTLRGDSYALPSAVSADALGRVPLPGLLGWREAVTFLTASGMQPDSAELLLVEVKHGASRPVGRYVVRYIPGMLRWEVRPRS